MRGNMVKAEEDTEDLKSKLVTEICLISSISCSCRHPRSFPGKSEFVDWYRLLRIQENAGIDVIRKRYHQLALQIHPDKNKHPNAGVAFKLVSEAYECLSNTSKRVEFDLEKVNRICTRCQRPRPSDAFGTLDKVNKKSNGTEFSSRRAKQETAKQEMKQAIKEEAEVIASSISICHQTPRSESPIFDPVMYSSGYPHRRTPLKCSGFLDSRRQQNEVHASRCNGRRNHQKKGEEFPVFENCNRLPHIFPNRTTHTVLKV
ncbi:unnamed protein product [Victoria cruziana]